MTFLRKSLGEALEKSALSLSSTPESLEIKKGSKRERKTPSTNGAAIGRLQQNVADWTPSQAHRDLACSLGHDDIWLNDQADIYRCWLANAKHKHTDFEAGFRNWIKRVHNERTISNGRENGHTKWSDHDQQIIAGRLAAESFAEKKRLREQAAESLLDPTRPHGHSPSSS